MEEVCMPWGDGTGPMGLGPMTGRRAGFCAGFGMPGAGRGFGRSLFRFGGFSGSMWYGQRYGRMFDTYRMDPATEREILQRQEQGLSASLDAVKKRLEELSASSDGAV
jgi:hypothetical protein